MICRIKLELVWIDWLSKNSLSILSIIIPIRKAELLLLPESNLKILTYFIFNLTFSMIFQNWWTDDLILLQLNLIVLNILSVRLTISLRWSLKIRSSLIPSSLYFDWYFLCNDKDIWVILRREIRHLSMQSLMISFRLRFSAFEYFSMNILEKTWKILRRI